MPVFIISYTQTSKAGANKNWVVFILPVGYKSFELNCNYLLYMVFIKKTLLSTLCFIIKIVDKLAGNLTSSISLAETYV